MGRDAATGVDAAGLADAAVTSDAAVTTDAATTMDASTGMDAAVLQDASAGQDAATTADAGAPVDPLAGRGNVEQVATGFMFTEGPQWDPARGVLFFSDIPSNRIHMLQGTVVTTFREPSGKANGLGLDRAGRLLAAEHFNRQVSVTTADGGVTTVVDRYQGQRFNSPNDLIMRSDGTLYFTDPPYGLEGAREVAFNGLYRLTPGGVLTAEDQGNANSTRPNGVVLSVDENTLYMADTALSQVFAWTVAGDGALSGKRLFASTMGGGDGMAVDARGNLYVSTSAGVEVFAPSGTRWGVITVPQEPANCAFGDGDARTLYITARTALYKVRLAGPGLY